MRQGMMRIGDADLRIGAVAGLAGELEGHHAGHVRLHRQHLQVEHQPRVVGIRGRHAGRPVEIRQLIVRRRRFRLLNAALDLAHGVEILADAHAIGGAEPALQPGDVVANPVEQAGAFAQRHPPIGRAAAVAEQPLEDDARMCLRGQRRRRRRPREIVLVDARVAVVALADGLEQVHRQLQRRQQRLPADLLRGDLIDGGAEVVVGALGPLRFRRAQKRGVGSGVRPRIGVLQLQVRDHRELIHERAERLQRRRELGQACRARRPARQVAAHRHVDEPQAPHRLGRRARQRRHRRHHRVEQRQRDSRPHAAKKRPARQGFPGDDHDAFLI